jgi:hypothetical protein
MGTFIYDTPSNHVELDDRTLMHLRIVVMNKLRRSEPFMFEVQMHDGSGHRSYWLHPGVPLQFVFFTNHPMHINRVWIEALMESASGPNGLTILPEPDEAAAESAAALPPVRRITPRSA